jgi:hypothetical protein
MDRQPRRRRIAACGEGGRVGRVVLATLGGQQVALQRLGQQCMAEPAAVVVHRQQLERLRRP